MHLYYKRTGFYPFFFNALIKVFIGLGVLVLLLVLLERHVVSVDTLMKMLMEHLPVWAVLGFFFLTESVLGLIAPDIFILWGRNFAWPMGMVTLLAVLSYLGGITAYYLGVGLNKWPRFRMFIEQKYSRQIDMVHKWGWLLIVVAALLPLPYAAMSTLAGMVGYPIKAYLLVGTTRFLRFWVYAWVLFNVL